MKVIGKSTALLIPRLQDMLFIAIFVGALMVGPRMINGDLGRHLIMGKYMVTTHNIPPHDLFSFTKPGQARPPYEWLAQVIFYSVYFILNLDGVVLFTALILALTSVVVFIDSYHRSRMPVLASLLTLWIAAASSIDWLTRPHILSFLFLALWIKWLDKIRRSEKISLWWLPSLMLVWANSHGGFILGFLAWIAYFAGWLWESWRKSPNINVGRRLMFVGGTSLITSIITPDLWRNWQGVLANNSIYILSHTSETMPPDFTVIGTLPFTILLATILVIMFFTWNRLPVSHILLLLGFALISLIMARNIPFFAIAAAPIMAGDLGRTLKGIPGWNKLEGEFARIDAGLKGYVWPVLIMIFATGFFTNYQVRINASFNQFNPQTFPVRAADWIGGHALKGNMFNDFNWGGYLLFRLWPGNHVFIDSQSDFYGESLTRQYAAILSGQGDWEAKLSQYNVAWIIVPPASGLAQSARAGFEWYVVYEDPTAVIFVRK